MKQSPRNTVSSPPSKSDVPLCKRDLPKFKSLRVTRCGLFSIFYKSTFLTNLRFHIETHPKTYRDFTCVSCKEVRLICSEGQKFSVSRALFHPEIASESNFYLGSHFGAIVAKFTILKVASSLTWCSHNLF